MALITHTLATASLLEPPEVTTQTPTETTAQPSSDSPASSNSEETLQNSEIHTGSVNHVSVTSNLSVRQRATDPSNIIQPVSQVHPLHEHNLDRHVAVRLPKLELPTFNGEPLECHLFWGCFEAATQQPIHNYKRTKIELLESSSEG